MILIRDATDTDIPALADLITQLGYPTTPGQMAARLERLAAEPNQRTLLAEDHQERQVVGLIGLFRHQSLEYDDCFVRILALVVSRQAQHRGVGQQLMAAAEGWAVAVGATRLVLNCGNRAERAAAHAFYPKIGFVHTTTGYTKLLRP